MNGFESLRNFIDEATLDKNKEQMFSSFTNVPLDDAGIEMKKLHKWFHAQFNKFEKGQLEELDLPMIWFLLQHLHILLSKDTDN